MANLIVLIFLVFQSIPNGSAIDYFQNGAYFDNPFKQIVLDKTGPFKILFVMNDDLSEIDTQHFRDAFDYVNEKLSPMISGPILDDVRFPNEEIGCAKPMCANISIPVDLSLPCQSVDENMTDREAPEISLELKSANQAGYSLVVYVVTHGIHANDSDCYHFEKMNQNSPTCRWFGPPAMGKVCHADKNHRPTHTVLIFCKSIDKFAIDQGELRMVILHEILHFLIGYMGAEGNATVTHQQWHDDHGISKEATFSLVTSPNVKKAVREYFRCEKLEGAEVPVRVFHNPYWLNPKWDHWSFRLFPDEILAPHASYDERISALTLAAIADSGWYRVDMNKSQALPSLHSSMNGCELATKSCYDLIKEARKKSDALYEIWPICDRTENISTRCSVDGRRRFLCHQIEDYGCNTLHSSACKDHHPICEYAKKQSYLYPRIGFTNAHKTMCITITGFPGISQSQLRTEVSLPPCIEKECKLKDGELILKFNPTHPRIGKLDECEYACTKDKSNKVVEYVPSQICKEALDPEEKGEKITLICPDYAVICDGAKQSQIKQDQIHPSPESKGSMNRIHDIMIYGLIILAVI